MADEIASLQARIDALEAELAALRRPDEANRDRVSCLALVVRDLLEASTISEPARDKLLDAATRLI